jgi:hypothetical protein
LRKRCSLRGGRTERRAIWAISLETAAKGTPMRRSALMLPLFLVTLAVAACGSTHDTTVVARPGSTVVVPDEDGHTKVITP